MKRTYRILITLLGVALTAISCVEKPENDDDPSYAETVQRQALEKAQQYLKENVMDVYYYWYDQVPRKGYTYKIDIKTYFRSLLYRKDRWSWMMDGQAYIEDETGIVSGTYGAVIGQPWMDLSKYFENDLNIVVKYVFPDSPFDKAGITRGCVMEELDSESVLEYYLTSEEHLNEFVEILDNPSTTKAHKFKFKKPDGEYITTDLVAAKTLNTRPGLVKKIFTADDYPGLTQPVGYFNYLSFKADDDVNGKSMLEDITEAMDYFKQNNVKTLILDLRYNGGGDSRASNLLVSYLAPASARGTVYVNRTHNNNLKSEDESSVVLSPEEAIAELAKTYDIPLSCKPDSPEFEQLFFITGSGSASASEMTLNGLKPLANVKHVGDTTYGKPNGMYVFYYPYDNAARAQYNRGDYSKLKYVFLPICFYNSNGQGQYIPDDGIIPDRTVPDDLYHDFDAGEMNIEACLYYVVNGSFPAPKPIVRQSAVPQGKVLMKLKRAEDSDENYGRYVVIPDFL